jgi:hypothetical protein
LNHSPANRLAAGTAARCDAFDARTPYRDEARLKVFLRLIRQTLQLLVALRGLTATFAQHGAAEGGS